MGSRKLSDEDITRIANEEGVDPAILMAVGGQENSYDDSISKATATTSGGAYGRFQIQPATFNQVYPSGDINNPEDNARGAARYIKKAVDKYGNDPTAVAGYYFAGPGFMSKNPDQDYGGITIRKYQQGVAKNYERLKTPFMTMAPEDADITEPDADADDTGTVINGVRPFIPASDDFSDNPDADATMIPTNTTASTPKGFTDNLSEAVQLARDQVGRVIDSGDAALAAAKQNITDQLASIGRQGDLAKTVELEKFKIEQQKGAENAALLSKLGINTSDTDAMVVQIAGQMKDEYQQAQQMRADIMDKQSVGLFDNPLEYIINQFTLPSDIAQHNAVIRQIKSQKDYVEDASSMVRNVSSANATKYASTTAMGAQAAAQIAQEKATQEAANLREKRAQEDYNYQYRNLNALKEQAALLEAQQRAIDNDKQKQTIEEAKAAAAKAQLIDDASVKQAGQMMGLDIPNRQTLKQMSKEKQDAVETVMASGGVFGKDPATVWKALTYGDSRKMPATTATQFQILSSFKKQAEEEVMRDPQLKTASPKQQQEAVMAKMAQKAQEISVDPNKTITTPGGGQTDNPYHMPTPENMAKNPATAGLALNGLIAAQKKMLPNTPITDGIILELAYSEVGPGKKYATIQDAAREVSQYYKGGVELNNNTMLFSNFGMPNQEIYKVKGIDATNYAKVMQYYITKDRQKSMGNAFGGAFGADVPPGYEMPSGMGGAIFPIGTTK